VECYVKCTNREGMSQTRMKNAQLATHIRRMS